MLVQYVNAPSKERFIGLTVLSGLALAARMLQCHFQARVLLSQPTPRTGLVGSLGVAEAITSLALVAILALLIEALGSVWVAPSQSHMDAAKAYNIVRYVADSGVTLAVIASVIVMGVAYSGRRSAFLKQLRRSRDEYLSSLKISIALGRTHAVEDDDVAVRSLRDVIRSLEDEFLESLRCRPEAIDEHDALHHALTEATDKLVALELERRISHVDVYDEEILNGPQDHRGGHFRSVWHSLLGCRNLIRAFGTAGRAVFASGLSVVFLCVLLASLNQGQPASEGNTDEATLRHTRPSLLEPYSVDGPAALGEFFYATGLTDQVTRPSVEAPDMLQLETYSEFPTAFGVGSRQADLPARQHPARLRRLHRDLVAKDSYAVALFLIERGLIGEARHRLRRLAENGDRDAALALGSTYDPMAIEGRQAGRYHRDQRRAVYWYRKAHLIHR